MFKSRQLLPCRSPVSLHLLASDINHHSAEVCTGPQPVPMAKHDSQPIHLLTCHGFIPAAFLHREVLLAHSPHRGDTNVSSCIQPTTEETCAPAKLQNHSLLASPTSDDTGQATCPCTIHQTCIPRQKSSSSILPHSHLMFLISPVQSQNHRLSALQA